MEFGDTIDNLNSFCRACLKEQQQRQMYSIVTMDMKLREWLQDPTLQYSEADDVYPKYVCDVCCLKLEGFLEFHHMCERSRNMYLDLMVKIPPHVKKDNLARTLESSDMIDVVQDGDDDVEDDDGDGTAVNCDWLDFDFVAAPLTSESSYRSVKNCKQESFRGEEILPSTSGSSAYQTDPLNTANSDWQEVTTPHNAPHVQHICEECGKVFEKLIQLRQHLYAHRPAQEHPYFCAECNKTFKNRRSLNEHQMRHAGIKNYECPYCGIRKTTKYELQAHVNYHTKERQWLCPNCPMIFNSTRNLRTHDQVVHQGLRRYVCQFCDQAFGKPDTLKHHIMTHTGEKPHECLECGKRFIQLVSLKNHMKAHDGINDTTSSTKQTQSKYIKEGVRFCNNAYSEEDNSSEECDIITAPENTCYLQRKHEEIDDIFYTHSKNVYSQQQVTSQVNKVTKPRSKIKSIKRLSENDKSSADSKQKAQHICEECGKIFATFVHLKQHQYSHKPPEEHPFHCSECKKTFRTCQSLNDHQLRHAGIKNYECPYCGMKKTTKSELRTHVNYHTKERQWLCPNCPMIFNSTSNLRRHDQVVHKGIRRYICRYCDEAFGKQETLKHHEMTHTGEKPHGCPECGKRFIQLVSLKTHMKTHSKS